MVTETLVEAIDRTAIRIEINGQIARALGDFVLLGQSPEMDRRVRQLKRRRVIFRKKCDHVGKEDGFCPKCLWVDGHASAEVRNLAFQYLSQDIITWYCQQSET